MGSSHRAILFLAASLLPVTSCGGGDSISPAGPARLVFSVQPSAATAGASRRLKASGRENDSEMKHQKSQSASAASAATRGSATGRL